MDSEHPAALGVVGGGRMGAGIAQVFATVGSDVVLVERDEGAAQAARARIASGLGTAADRGKLPVPAEEVLARTRVVAAVDELPSDLDLVVEAVPEQAALKVEVLTAVEGVVSDRTVLASNTSSLPITELAAALAHPGRFLGMHFFNPVPASKLVEIVVGPETSPATVESVRCWTRAIGKADVVVRDSPGFASSRLGLALGLEAIRMLEEGVASAEDIDAAMELGYRHPMGPLRLTDLVGLDVRLAIAEHLQATLGARFAPPQLLRDLVAEGRLGRKSGHGFHHWG
jgi:3-hydroxybutyryl-CoA dehydrogenase